MWNLSLRWDYRKLLNQAEVHCTFGPLSGVLKLKKSCFLEKLLISFLHHALPSSYLPSQKPKKVDEKISGIGPNF